MATVGVRIVNADNEQVGTGYTELPAVPRVGEHLLLLGTSYANDDGPCGRFMVEGVRYFGDVSPNTNNEPRSFRITVIVSWRENLKKW